MKNFIENPEYWEPDPELEGLVSVVARFTGGMPDDSDGHRINSHGVGDNCAEIYSNEIFAIRDFCWCDGSIHPQNEHGVPNCPPNFEHFASGLKATWYKNLGRDMRFNAEPEVGEVLAIMLDCAMSLSLPEDPNQNAGCYARPDATRKAAWGWVTRAHGDSESNSKSNSMPTQSARERS